MVVNKKQKHIFGKKCGTSFFSITKCYLFIFSSGGARGGVSGGASAGDGDRARGVLAMEVVVQVVLPVVVPLPQGQEAGLTTVAK